MKKIAATISILLLVLMMTVSCALAVPEEEEGPTEIPKFEDEPTTTQKKTGLDLTAEDFYAGPIDNFTGVPYGSAEEEIGGDRIYINSTTAYDRDRHLFLMFNGSTDVLSTVADGTITTQSVSLVLDESALYVLFRDGESVSDIDPMDIREPGFYVLRDTGDNSREIMRFTIVSEVTGQLERFEVPSGFEITQVMLEGINIEHKATYVSLAQEGEYVIAYRCPATETHHSFNVRVDHTPPQLQLLAVNEDGYAKGPVDISDLEPGARISIRRNGSEIPYTEELTQRGEYVIVLGDEAGNLATYQFAIRAYFNVNSIIFLALILLLAAGVGVYVLYSRRHLRVR